MTQAIDLLIERGTVITMDPTRRVIDDGAVAVHGDRIVAVGSHAEALRQRYSARKTIDAHRKAVLPGLIDSHAHAGHGLVRTMGAGDPDAWMNACGAIYTTASDEAFWRAEVGAGLARATEGRRRRPASRFSAAAIDHARRRPEIRRARIATRSSAAGTRSVVAVGPSRPPDAATLRRLVDRDRRRRREIDSATMLDVCDRRSSRDNHGSAPVAAFTSLS